MTAIKKSVLAADFLLIISPAVFVLARRIHSELWSLSLQLQFPVLLWAYWFFIVRLKCPHCEGRLSQHFPAGALPMLPLSSQQCRACDKPL